MNTKLHPAKFSIDTLGSVVFEGFTSGETWNGWDCPYFTFEQGQKVMEVFNATNTAETARAPSRYDEERDAFCFFIESIEDSDDFYALIIEGQKFYPIGTGCWIWERVDKWDKE